MKPRRCAIVGYALAGMCFNSVSTRHTLDMFHVCYEVTSVNTAEPRSVMHDSDRRNTGKSVDHGSVMERSVAGAVERSGIKKNKGKIAISSQGTKGHNHLQKISISHKDFVRMIGAEVSSAFQWPRTYKWAKW